MLGNIDGMKVWTALNVVTQCYTVKLPVNAKHCGSIKRFLCFWRISTRAAFLKSIVRPKSSWRPLPPMFSTINLAHDAFRKCSPDRHSNSGLTNSEIVSGATVFACLLNGRWGKTCLWKVISWEKFVEWCRNENSLGEIGIFHVNNAINNQS